MDLNKVEKIAHDSLAARKEHKSREPGWLYYHGLRTAKIAVWLCDQLKADADREVIYSASLFHDIGKGYKPHNEIGAIITWQLLEPLCTTDELEAVCETIRLHNLRGNGAHPDRVKIVQDADMLDHVGMIGVWSCFYWSGAHDEAFEDHTRFICGEENTRMRMRMREGLNFDPSRRMFDERIVFEDIFFAQFHRVYKEGLDSC